MIDWAARWQHRAIRWIHRNSDATACVSESIVADLVESGVPAQLIRVVPNGIDVETVRRLANQPSAVPPAPGRRTVVAAGRLSRAKGFDLLIRAHGLLRDADAVPHRIVILGDGPERGKLVDLAESLEVRDSVVFAGFQANPLPDIASADLLCMPSRYEGFPLVLLEALALGVPVIASPSGRDLLDEGAYGIIVPAESPESLAGAIDAHLRNPVPLRTLAERGPDQARRYDWASVARQHLDWLVELAGQAPYLSARDPARCRVLATAAVSAVQRHSGGTTIGLSAVLNENAQPLAWRAAGARRRSWFYRRGRRLTLRGK
jgi:glycosyltransferase involved in cell wall biosynthesis